MRRFRFLAMLLPTLAFGNQTFTILHTNDLHAHIEPVSISKQLYGGYARQATLIKRFRQSDPNVVLLNAGDTCQGTIFYNTYEGLADLAILNTIGYDAATIGNHEFDRGPRVITAFLKNAAFPIVSCNIDASAEAGLAPLIVPSTVLHVAGADLGIVGVTTPDTENISSPGPNIKFLDIATSVQKAVDDLNKKGINKVIVLSHIGYQEDIDLAGKLHGVALIVGGHSHTPLGTPALPGWPKPDGPYPTYAHDTTGHDVVIVQDWEWGKALGRLKVTFDDAGHIVKVTDAAPIPLDSSIPEDPTIKSMVDAFNLPIENVKKQVVGNAAVPLLKAPNATGESLMADVIADSMLAATTKAGSVAAFVNSGGVRGDLVQGPITYAEAISVQPFGNTLTTLDLTGAELLQSLEIGVGTGGQLNPSAGSSYHIDAAKPAGSRVSEVVIAGSPLDLTKVYRLTFLNFTANGGDHHTVLQAAKGARTDTGLVDVDALIDYLRAHQPISPSYEGRVVRG